MRKGSYNMKTKVPYDLTHRGNIFVRLKPVSWVLVRKSGHSDTSLSVSVDKSRRDVELSPELSFYGRSFSETYCKKYQSVSYIRQGNETKHKNDK